MMMASGWLDAGLAWIHAIASKWIRMAPALCMHMHALPSLGELSLLSELSIYMYVHI